VVAAVVGAALVAAAVAVALGAALVGAALVGAALVGAADVAAALAVGDSAATRLPLGAAPPPQAMSAANASTRTAVVAMTDLMQIRPPLTEPLDCRHVTWLLPARFLRAVIDLPFDPDLVLGPLRTTWHSLVGVLGIVAGAALGIRSIRSRVRFADAYAIALGSVLGGIVMSRVFHVIDAWAAVYARDPLAALAVWNGGASITGGIAGGLLAALVVMRSRRLPAAFIFDRAVIGLPLGMAIGRLGDLINGEHWARACGGVAWCVRYTHPNSPGQREYVHPAVAYELALDLVIVAVLIALLPWADRQARRPQLVFVFLGLYGVARLALGAYRLDPVFVLGLSQAEVVSTAFIVISIGALVWLKKTGPRPPRVDE
jgi:phosphatidylglycerol:prolipoprotein diacylglycerol transferase